MPRQREIERAVKAVTGAGLTVHGVEIAPNGAIRVLTGEAHALPVDPFERWKAEYGPSLRGEGRLRLVDGR